MKQNVEKHITRSEKDTLALAERVARTLHPGNAVALDGPLGAGKTAFVRGLVLGLGGDPGDVSSPTFVISQEYATKSAPLVHVDAYRLADPAELETIGWDEMLAARDAIIAVEWAERIAPALPSGVIQVSIAYVADEPSHRAITISGAPATSIMRPCPICKAPTPADSEFAPFCSRRCKRADLGRWLTGKYTISRPISERDIESQD
jgi:tRNA threonylcarbamoyladenosine biosynthesis protein TsaE